MCFPSVQSEPTPETKLSPETPVERGWQALGLKICSPPGENKNGSAPRPVRGAGKPSDKKSPVGKMTPAVVIRVTQ